MESVEDVPFCRRVYNLPTSADLSATFLEVPLRNVSNKVDESEAQNVETYCRMNYRRQLRASHLKIINKMKKYNQVLRNDSRQRLEY